MTYDEAVAAARRWFAQPEVVSESVDAKALGSRRDLYFCPIGEVFTIGHALAEYVEWKRLVPAGSSIRHADRNKPVAPEAR